jgi:hypothetical protein
MQTFNQFYRTQRNRDWPIIVIPDTPLQPVFSPGRAKRMQE